MSLMTVEGIYRDGRVELSEQPEGVEGARVLITFLPAATGPEGQDERERAIARVLEDMERGIDLGGPPYPTREEIYEERLKRFDR